MAADQVLHAQPGLMQAALFRHSMTYLRRRLNDDVSRSATIRNMLIVAGNEGPSAISLDDLDEETPAGEFYDLVTAVTAIFSYEYGRDEVSQLAMDLSLCPMHFVDWAICFDDEDPTCEQIRAVFPHSHDT